MDGDGSINYEEFVRTIIMQIVIMQTDSIFDLFLI